MYQQDISKQQQLTASDKHRTSVVTSEVPAGESVSLKTDINLKKEKRTKKKKHQRKSQAERWLLSGLLNLWLKKKEAFVLSF